MLERERCFSVEQATLSGPVAMDKEKFVAAARNLAGEKRQQKNK